MILENKCMNDSPLSHEKLAQENHIKHLSKRIGTLIAEFEVAQEKIDKSQGDASSLIELHQQKVMEQLAEIEKQSNSMAELMTETGAARFRIATEQQVMQNQQQLDKLDALFQSQQRNFEAQQHKLDNIISSHLLEMKKTEKRLACKIQNFIERLNVEEMREMADTARQAIEESSSSAIYQCRQFLLRFQWKNIAKRLKYFHQYNNHVLYLNLVFLFLWDLSNRV